MKSRSNSGWPKLGRKDSGTVGGAWYFLSGCCNRTSGCCDVVRKAMDLDRWGTPIIPAHERQRRGEACIWGQPGLRSEALNVHYSSSDELAICSWASLFQLKQWRQWSCYSIGLLQDPSTQKSGKGFCKTTPGWNRLSAVVWAHCQMSKQGVTEVKRASTSTLD